MSNWADPGNWANAAKIFKNRGVRKAREGIGPDLYQRRKGLCMKTNKKNVCTKKQEYWIAYTIHVTGIDSKLPPF